MNGRVYDYNLGKFMSVDPFIHLEGNSQGFNPYSYLLNNPLAGTDPTGYDPNSVGNRSLFFFGLTGINDELAIANAEAEAASGNMGATDSVESGIGTRVGAGAFIENIRNGVSLKEAGQAAATTTLAASAKKGKRNSNISTNNGSDNTNSSNSASQKPSDVGVPERLSPKDQLKHNIAQGKEGEAKVRQELGDANRGEQVTVETLDGTRARVDFVKRTDGQTTLVEVKTGKATLSKGQRAVKKAIDNGEPVIPRGANAEKAGLPVGEMISCSFEEKRC